MATMVPYSESGTRPCSSKPIRIFFSSSAIFILTRRLRGDRLKEIGEAFKIDRYSTVSTIVERMKVRIERDEGLRKRVDHLTSTIQMSQEQT